MWAKHVKKTRGLNTVLNTADMGGYRTLLPHVKLGFVKPNVFTPESDEPWIWVNDSVSGALVDDSVGAVIFDSGTSYSEVLLSACSHSDVQIGQQKTQRFTVSRGTKETGPARSLTVSINNEAHYGVVQSFMLDAIWKSTWLSRKGIDVIWNFSVYRGEDQERTPILGPKLAGKALTAAIPKWFEYTFRLESIAQEGAAPIHRMYLTEHTELAGMGHSFGNARYPIDAVTALPASIEPASLIEAIRLVEEVGQAEAEEALRIELGL